MSSSDLLRFFKSVQHHSFTVIHNTNRILNQQLFVSIGSHNSFSIFATSFNIALDNDCWRMALFVNKVVVIN